MGSGDIIFNQSGLVWHGRVRIHVIFYLIDNWEADDKLEVYFNGNLLDTLNFVSTTDGVSNYCGWSHINDLKVEKFWEFNNN